MPKQLEIDLGAEGLAALWSRIPEAHRREAITTWARVLTEAARIRSSQPAVQAVHTASDAHASPHVLKVNREKQEFTANPAQQGAAT